MEYEPAPRVSLTDAVPALVNRADPRMAGPWHRTALASQKMTSPCRTADGPVVTVAVSSTGLAIPTCLEETFSVVVLAFVPSPNARGQRQKRIRNRLAEWRLWNFIFFRSEIRSENESESSCRSRYLQSEVHKAVSKMLLPIGSKPIVYLPICVITAQLTCKELTTPQDGQVAAILRQPSTSRLREVSMQGKTILLVEDNPDDEALARRAFKQNNITNTLVVARDGREALDYLLGQNALPDGSERTLPEVVLLDLKLPKAVGLEVLRTLRSSAKTKLLPVVIPTTSDEAQDRMNGCRLGANSFIRKPVEFGDFMEAVRQLGTYWLLLNQAAPRSTGK